jgi:hypothetical protein
MQASYRIMINKLLMQIQKEEITKQTVFIDFEGGKKRVIYLTAQELSGKQAF